MTTTQQNWIHFKTQFCTAHRELEETRELKMEDAGYHQANLVKNIVAHMYGLIFTYLYQYPDYTLVPKSDPTIIPTLKSTPVANVATYSASNILPQLLTRMQHMQKLLILMQTNKTGGGGYKPTTATPVIRLLSSQ